jgi:nitroimidazol reductase NimA-like FMN-containing flavoprotein (pyridoxamine 5'-phosphate oxidase superfamily)
MLSELSRDESLALLRRKSVARLGCIVDNYPYVVPVNYLFDGDCAYSHSLPGSKIAALRLNSRACLQVDDIEDAYHWQSVLAFGNFEEITSPRERAFYLNRLLARFPQLTPVEARITQDAEPPPVIVFRIRIKKLSGISER